MLDKEIKEYIKKTFNTVAKDYEKEQLRFFADSSIKLVEHIPFRGDENVLDVATGTGITAVAMAEKLTNGKVIGIDMSEKMLSVAISKKKELGIGNIEFLKMDMENMLFSGYSFHLVTCSYGVFFVEEIKELIESFYRVLKENGKCYITTFDEDAFKPLMDFFIRDIGAYKINVSKPDEKWLNTPKACASMFESAGFKEVNTKLVDLSYYLESVDDWWQILMSAGHRGYIEQLDDKSREEFKKEHLGNIKTLLTDKGILLNVKAIFTEGEKIEAI
ncbi:MAG: methyltransferase domain-containing protein [Bacteroidales bacterium]|nr:methyltransferase domain-containing protein [Bacteroidales bacterium]